MCIFNITANPMKYYNKVFDIFLYEGVFIFLFSLLLLLLNDIYTEIFFPFAWQNYSFYQPPIDQLTDIHICVSPTDIEVFHDIILCQGVGADQ